ncbi:hypothetical protein DCC39_04410 [Pueribacillus theae]|uniref:Uncharacterized protein n=1 Tax=Pueribacillus theae TaxID=2171751 RepID=A0A2U1K608_9BACI|nr:hypothetical protein [Pueribacillus theae]PWA12685.1 hypothetical protein DCC39_04410 [Pueribacillus theae]
MSDKKRRRAKEIHVDKLIVKANEVIFVDEDGNKKEPRNEEAPVMRDPWGFFFPPRPEQTEGTAEREEHTGEENQETANENQEANQEENQPGGWRWI